MSFRNSFLSILIVEVGIALLAVINYGVTLEAIQALTRFSGRVSLIIFSLIFLFQHHQFIKIKSILSDKYYLVFAIAHGIHLVILLTYVFLSGIPLVPIRLAGGFLAYLFIFAMPWMEIRFQQAKFTSKQFSALTLIYLYYVWLIFFMTYLSRVQGTFPNAGGSYLEHIILLGWASLMLGLKLSQGILRKPNKI
jgi:hypothetical protein